MNKRTIVYVDAFNLYYLSLKWTFYKWLDIKKLCSFYFPNNNIEEIKYFTADVSARQNDPTQHIRQQIYLRALKTIPKLKIIKGYYQENEKMMPIASIDQKIEVILFGFLKLKLPIFLYKNKLQYIKVIKSEEKGSDVNLASHLLKDCHEKLLDEAIIISNDSDLKIPIKMAINNFKIPVHILNPDKNTKSNVFFNIATSTRKIQNKRLKKSQFNNSLNDKNGVFQKPIEW